jgi:hypothetical protein
MRKMALIGAAVLGLGMLPFSEGAAQGIGIGPQIGYQKAADADNGNLLVGGALRVKLASFIGAEASIGYRSEEFADGELDVRSWPVMVTGLIYPLPILYGAMGFGWYNTTFDFQSEQLEDRTDHEVGWHFGGGAELPLGRKASLTGDIRYVFLDYDFEEVPGFGDTDANFYVITVGLMLGL